MVDLQAAMKKERLDVQDEFHADKPDKGKIDAAIAKLGDLQVQVRQAHVQFWFDVNKILTADQQKVWKRAAERLLQERGRMMAGGWMRRGEGGRRGGMFPR